MHKPASKQKGEPRISTSGPSNIPICKASLLMVDTSTILETPWTISNSFRNKPALFGQIDAKDFGLTPDLGRRLSVSLRLSCSHDADELDKHGKHDTVAVFQVTMLPNRELSLVVDDKKSTIENRSIEAAVYLPPSPT